MAWGIGLDRLSDNSFLTHLATGRVILDTGHVPTVDLYSFTAPGEPWVVQSWFSSVLFAAAAELGHGAGLRLLIAGILALLAGLAWRLSRAAESLLPRVALIGAFVGVGAGMWAERPFLIGLVALALTMLAVERDLDPRWLVPIGWIWVNSHGSFPLGIAYVVIAIVGDRLDGADTAAAVRTLKWLIVGVLVGSLNPLGPRLLWFPVELLAKQDALRNIGEWQAPEFTGPGQRLFLLQLAAGLLLLVRRPRYRSALLLVVFGLAALVSARNITVASLVFVPVIAAGLPTVGTLRSSARPALAGVPVVVVLGFAGLLAATSLERSTFDLSNYPVRVLDFLDEHQVDRSQARLAHPDVVGNYLELRYEDEAEVFIDDRVDMYPQQVIDDNLSFLAGDRRVPDVLDRYDISLVLLPVDDAVAGRMRVDPAWSSLTSADDWQLFCRVGSDLGGDLGGCEA